MYHECTKCGHIDEIKNPPRWEPLSSGLVATLWAFADAVGCKGVNDIHLEYDMNLTHKQHANFQKLRYHGLVHKPEKGKKDGRWLLTRKGGLFLGDRLTDGTSKKVLVQDNHVIAHSPEKTTIRAFYGKHPEFQSRFDYEIDEGNVFKKILQPKLL